MFHPAAVMVNEGLVQFPWSWVGPNSTRAGPDGAVDGGLEVVVVAPPAAVVVVDELPPEVAEVVVVEPEVDLGIVYAGAFDDGDDEDAPTAR